MSGRAASRLAALAVVLALAAPPAIARAQATPKPSRADDNASIVRPLAEIGRVRARTPYCAALARARPGIDAALAYEYAVPLVGQDLRRFRQDSELTRAQSLKKTEHDLKALYELAIAGRAEVIALRTAAGADADEQHRKALLDFANAVDSAKGRQISLARALSNIVGTLAEKPVYTNVNKRSDDLGASAFNRAGGINDLVALDRRPTPSAFTDTQGDTMDEHDRLQSLFATFEAERLIRDDLKAASERATAAMQLGGCTTTP